MNKSNLYVIEGVKFDYDIEVLEYIVAAYPSLMNCNLLGELTFVHDSLKSEYMFIGKLISFEEGLSNHSRFDIDIKEKQELGIHDLEIIIDVIGGNRSAKHGTYLIADCF